MTNVNSKPITPAIEPFSNKPDAFLEDISAWF